MNMHGMPQHGVVPGIGMPGVGVSPGLMQQTSPQQQLGNPIGPQNPQQQTQQVEKTDNVSKAKSLVGPLRESLSVTLKTAAQLLQQNNLTDIGTMKGVDSAHPRFDKHLEEFYSICDQIELHLKTSTQCVSQSSSAQHYLNINVAATRTETLPPTDNTHLSYPQYLATVRTQIGYAKEIHDTLICAAQNISPSE